MRSPGAFNKSVELPVEIWSSNRVFPSAEKVLRTLDTIFLFSYAVVSFRTLSFSVEERCK